MRTSIKILLSLGVIILSFVVSVLMKGLLAPNELVFMPAAFAFWIILIGGLIGVWTYKPGKSDSVVEKDLDKTE